MQNSWAGNEGTSHLSYPSNKWQSWEPRQRTDQIFRRTVVQITLCNVSYSSPFPSGKAHREMEKYAEQMASLVQPNQGAASSQVCAHSTGP